MYTYMYIYICIHIYIYMYTYIHRSHLKAPPAAASHGRCSWKASRLGLGVVSDFVRCNKGPTDNPTRLFPPD